MASIARAFARSLIVVALGFVAAPGQARADFSGILGIQIDQTILIPTGDPEFGFDFKASLVAMNGLKAGDFIVFDDIPDYASAMFTSPDLQSSVFSVSTSAGSAAGLTNVKFTFTSSLDVSNPNAFNIPLGDFIVATTDNFDPAHVPSKLLVPITYMVQTTSTIPPNPKNQGTGIAVVSSIVPEPSSLLLIGLGLATGLGFAGARRRPQGRNG